MHDVPGPFLLSERSLVRNDKGSGDPDGWHCGMRNYDHRHKKTCQGREVAIGAIVRDIGLGDVARLAREDDLLRIEASLAR